MLANKFPKMIAEISGKEWTGKERKKVRTRKRGSREGRKKEKMTKSLHVIIRRPN